MLQIGQMEHWPVLVSVNLTVKRRHCVGDGIQHTQYHRKCSYQLLGRRQHPQTHTHTTPYGSSGVLSLGRAKTFRQVTV